MIASRQSKPGMIDANNVEIAFGANQTRTCSAMNITKANAT